MKRIRNILFILLFLGLSTFVLVEFYPYIFSRKVSGVITAVERVNPPMAIMTRPSQDVTAQMYSFAVGVRDNKTGEIVTGSTEDRQWAVAREGLCAEAEFFPYPPWKLQKWGTYFNARLLRLHECDGSAPVPSTTAPPAAEDSQTWQ
ncbi:MAG: hypothetical protein KF802_01755 [Bdellovibrionaceae bacterium]|nr:hypothetical protein [Pseudobdellovibrionaceae bacterium]MBX3033958.1 hypothetical protein [Pseudobdellovibrionaceae bacterium]